MAAGTQATLLTGESDEHFVAGFAAADTGEAEVQVAAAEKIASDLADDRAPGAVLLGETFVVRALERGQISLDGLVQR